MAIHVDFETYNTLDLKAVGADLYAAGPDLKVTVVAWAIDDGPVDSLVDPAGLPAAIRDHLDQGGQLRAWNAAFEWAILAHHYKLELPWDQVECSMQQALYHGLSAALEDAGPALGLPEALQKNTAGTRLMRQMAKPGRDGKRPDDPAKLARLAAYCRQDVTAERTIADLLPPLPQAERIVSALDHQVNQRGIRLDLPLVDQLHGIAADETVRLDQECAVLTQGAVTSPGTEHVKLAQWLADQGLVVANGLDKPAVAKLLVEAEADDVRRVLEIRQEAAKSSVRKLTAMTRAAGPDERVKGTLVYYGAHTGRFSGRNIQPQNLPRPTVPLLDLVIAGIRCGLDGEGLDLIYAPPLEVVASSLRSCLIPGPGKAFVVYDLKQIEARVLAWMAGQSDTLQAFADGEDVYVLAQQKLGLPSRLAGKVVTLACGYQMGADRFQETAATYGLIIDRETAAIMVRDWRAANPEIVALWRALEMAARQALAYPDGTPAEIDDKVAFAGSILANGETLLTMRLPSGRELFYRNVRLEAGNFGRDELVYDGIHQETRQWKPIKTYGGRLCENAVSAVARDILVEAVLRIDHAKLGDLVLTVHDDIVEEVAAADAESLAPQIQATIEQSLAWAPDLPVAAEGGLKASYGV